MTTPGLLLDPAEEVIYGRLIAQMSRAGRAVDLVGCARLAVWIQAEGHRSPRVQMAAIGLGLDPEWLPRRRTG